MGRELDYFRQASQPQNEVLAELSPGKADAFFKMIFILANVIDYIKIQGSKLYQRMKNLPNVLFYADFTALVGENVNLDFQTSKMDLSKLRKLRRNKHVIILDGQIQQAYVVTNGSTQVLLTKHVGPSDIPSFPEINTAKIIGVEIETDEASVILDDLGKPRYVTLHVFDDQIGIVEGDNGWISCFHENSLFEYQKTEPNWIFRSYAFMEISGQLMSFKILNSNGQFWLHTKITMGMDMCVEQFEILDIVKGGR